MTIKIIKHCASNQILFCDLDAGEIFEYNGGIFIKVQGSNKALVLREVAKDTLDRDTRTLPVAALSDFNGSATVIPREAELHVT